MVQPIFNQVEFTNLENSISSVKSQIELVKDHYPQPEPHIAEYLKRGEVLLDYVDWHFNNSDPFLVSGTVLTQVRANLDQMYNQLHMAISNGNINHVPNINPNIDEILSILSGFNSPKTKPDISGLRSALTKYISDIDKEHGAINEALKEVRKQSDEVSAAIVTEEEKITNLLDNLEKDFIASMKRWDEVFSNLIDERKKEYDVLITNFTQQFGQRLQTMSSGFEKDANEQLVKMLSKNEIIEDLEKQTELRLDSLISEATKIVGAVSKSVVQSDFKRVANEERTAKNWWNLATIASFIGLIVVVLINAYNHNSSEVINWGTILARWGIIVPFSLLGGFCAKQASHHNKIEQRNRRMELELSAIGPFLSEGDTKEVFELKKELVKKMFGKEETTEIKELSAKGATSLLDSVAKIIKEFKT